MPSQPIFITGQVMMDDGTPPPQNIIIERVCNGSPHSEGYTDSKGYFSIRLGDPNNAMIHDASEEGLGSAASRDGFGGNSPFGQTSSGGSRGLGVENRFFACDLRARLGGYRSQSVSLANRRPMDPPDIGIILLHRMTPSEGSTVSAVSLAAPKDARKAYDKGMKALKDHKAKDATKEFQKAVDAYPKYAAAWFELGRLQLAGGDAETARKSFEAAASADPKFPSPLMELAVMDAKAEKWDAVAKTSGEVIQLDSFDYPQAHYLNALSNYFLKNFDAAEKSSRETAKLDTRKQFPGNFRLLGVLLANKQDYTAAAQQFKTYLEVAPTAPDVGVVRNQLAQVEKLLGGKQ